MTWLELLWKPEQIIIYSEGRRPRDRGSIHSRNKDGIAFTFSIIIWTISNVAERNCDLVQFGVFARENL
jgi:hypothetical protein